MIILESVNLWPARTERLWSETSLISRCHPDFLLPKSMERALTWWRRPRPLEAKRPAVCRYVESNAKRCPTRTLLMAWQSMIVISVRVTSVIWRMAPWFEICVNSVSCLVKCPSETVHVQAVADLNERLRNIHFNFQNFSRFCDGKNLRTPKGCKS